MNENHLIAIYFAVIIMLLIGTMVFRHEIDGDIIKQPLVKCI